MRIVFALSLALLVASCSNSTISSSKDGANYSLESFTNDKNAKQQQLFLRITDEMNTDSSKIFVAKSIFDKDTVGLKIEVLKDIIPGINKDNQPIQEGFSEGSVRLSSIGAESDNFVKALGTLFNQPVDGQMTQEVLVPTVFSSNQEIVNLDKAGTYRFKLFLDNEVGEPAEIFAVLDTYRKAFELSEKDSVYRVPLISAFLGK